MANLEQIAAIATTTFYRPGSENDAMRAELAKNTIRTAAYMGYHVVVVDGGSSDEFLKEISSYGLEVHLHHEPKMGLGESRRHAISMAMKLGRYAIAWVEPEKADYIRSIADTVRPIDEGAADMVVPRRTSLDSYPTTQQHAEKLGNFFWKDLTGHDLDMWFGPRTFRRDIAAYFTDYNGEYGDKWDSIFIPVMNAIADGKKVASVNVDYTHPAEQTAFEDHRLDFHWKRIQQLQNLLPSLETHWKNRMDKGSI